MSIIPNVLILSDAQNKTFVNDIAKNIVKNDANSKTITVQDETETECKIIGHSMHINNRYFQSDLVVVPFEKDFNMIPSNILKITEVVLIYFDSKDKDFKSRLSNYSNLLKKNNIELGILICDQLYDDSVDGITYFEAKQEFKILDVIELNNTSNNSYEMDGYYEINEALNNFIWSNVQYHETRSKEKVLQSAAEQADEENTNENEMRKFEKLLMEAMKFKNNNSTVSRDDRLNNAEKFAEEIEVILDVFSSGDEL